MSHWGQGHLQGQQGPLQGQKSMGTAMGDLLAKQRLGLMPFPFCVGLCFHFLKANTEVSWGGKQAPLASCARDEDRPRGLNKLQLFSTKTWARKGWKNEN